MNWGRRSEKYLRAYGASPQRPLATGNIAGIERVVVIPALAEKGNLFHTLVSLAGNPPSELRRTLVICVVNNHRPPWTAAEEIRDNQETLFHLRLLLSEGRHVLDPAEGGEEMAILAGSDLRLAVIDASSPGAEIGDGDGGVGTARKIGMDAALEVLAANGDAGRGGILCLDADTLVDQNYLAAFVSHFAATGDPAAVAAYAHRTPADRALRRAICSYEIFLRAYVLGLSLACSPYAYHAIGSTMACTAEGYTAVRGMNRRGAAEDFHFLNKLAKIGPVGVVTATTVYPSARVSHRVPFGTGRQMQRSVAEPEAECRLHHPDIFLILRDWLAEMAAAPDRDTGTILVTARRIHRLLADFLQQDRFTQSWGRIRQNACTEAQLRRQFHGWFDGLRTLRLIHFLARNAFPPVEIAAGLSGLLAHLPVTDPAAVALPEGGSTDGLWDLLEHLRVHFPRT